MPSGERFGYAILVANLDNGIPSEFSWLNDLNPQQQAAEKVEAEAVPSAPAQEAKTEEVTKGEEKKASEQIADEKPKE